MPTKNVSRASRFRDHNMGHARSTARAQPEPAKRGDASDARSGGALRPIVINPTARFTVVVQTVAREEGKEGMKQSKLVTLLTWWESDVLTKQRGVVLKQKDVMGGLLHADRVHGPIQTNIILFFAQEKGQVPRCLGTGKRE